MSALDNPPVDPDFRNSLSSISASWTFKGLDEGNRNDVRAMTFYFDPVSADALDSVTIEARIRGLTGFENDLMVLDSVGNNRPIAQMTGYSSAGDWMTVLYEFSTSEFSLLADGQLNLAFYDDSVVDWVKLSWNLANDPLIIPGDYNGDGRVDSADYTVWRDSLGATGVGLAADGNGDLHVNADDYAVWRANFGRADSHAAWQAGVLAASQPAAVPEPSGLLLLLVGLAFLSGSSQIANRRLLGRKR
jgi:hypothetical protein